MPDEIPKFDDWVKTAKPRRYDEDSALDLIAHHESGGRNIKQQVVPAGGGYNPSVGRVTGPSTASGPWQITNSTWRKRAPREIAERYPTAMAAPVEVQRAVAGKMYRETGFQDWEPYNASLRGAIARGEQPRRTQEAQQIPKFDDWVKQSATPEPTPQAATPITRQSGQVEAGNIDLTNRPRVKNPDGTISTVRSMSTNIDGREVLLPTVSDDGRILTDEQAIDQYKRTGKHLGIFSTPEAATTYAQQLHEQQAKTLETPSVEPGFMEALNRVTQSANRIQQQVPTALTRKPKVTSTVRDVDSGEVLEAPKAIQFQPGTQAPGERVTGIKELERQKYIEKPAQSQLLSGEYTANLGKEGGHPEALSKAALRSLGVPDDLNTIYRQATGRNLLLVNNAKQDREGNFRYRVSQQAVNFINAFQSGLSEGGVDEGLRRAAEVNQSATKEIAAANEAAKQAASQDVTEARAAADRGVESPFLRGVTGSAARAAQAFGSVLPMTDFQRKAQVMRAAAEQAEEERPLQGVGENIAAGVGEAIPTAMMFAATQPLGAAQLPALGAAEGFTPEERLQGAAQGLATHATFGIPNQLAPQIGGVAKRALTAGTVAGIPVGEALARGESPVRALAGSLPYAAMGALQGKSEAGPSREPLGLRRLSEMERPSVPEAQQRELRAGEIREQLAPFQGQPRLERTTGRPPAFTPEPANFTRDLITREATAQARPVESIAPREFVVAAEPQGARKNVWQHRDFGRVQQAENQTGVGVGKVRVIDEQGVEHVIKRSNGRGQNNQIAIPVREAGPVQREGFTVIDKRGQPKEPAEVQPTGLPEGAATRVPEVEAASTPEVNPHAEAAKFFREEVPANVKTLHDMTAKASQDARVAERRAADAETDTKTGLLIPSEWAKASTRIGKDKATDIAYFDANNLKTLNDTFGHDAGDRYLAHIGKVIREEATKLGITERQTFRAGGDEFAIAVPKGQGEQLVKAVKDRVGAYEDQGVRGGMAGGVGGNAKAADRAMYADKAAMKAQPRAEASIEPRLARAALQVAPAPSAQPPLAPITRTAQRSFPKSAERAGLPGGENRTYDPLTNAESLAKADAHIEKVGIDRAVSDLAFKKDIGAEDTATGIRLMQELTKAGDVERAAQVAGDLAEKLTKAGQATQAASIIARLSPEGVLLTAQRKLPAGKSLTAEQSEGLVGQAKKVQEADARIADLERQVAEMRAPRPVRRTAAEKIGTAEDYFAKLEQEVRARYQARGEALKGQKLGSQAGASAIPMDLADLAIIGAAKVARKGMSAAKWTAEMAAEFGDEIKPHLQKLYKDSYALYNDHKKQMQSESQERGVRRENVGPQRPEDINKLIEQRAVARKDARTERAEMARIFNDLTATRLSRAKAFVGDVANVPRSLKSSMDLSAPRQAAMWMINHPIQAGRVMFSKQLRAMREVNYDKFVDELASDPDYPLMTRSGLALTTTDARPNTLTGREEQFMSRLAGKIPGIKHSERAYTTFLDTARSSWFKQLKNQAEAKAQSEGRQLTTEDHQAIANFVNIATGRGNLGKGTLNNMSPFLNALFFAPKFAASKVQIFDPRVYSRLPPGARASAMREAATYFGALTTTAMLLKFGLGAQVGLNPEDSEFMKLRVGNTRYDLANGTGQYIVLASRLFRNAENKRTGKKDKFGRSFMDNVDRFARYKYSPPAALVRNVYEGKNAIGEKTSLKKELGESVAPLFLKDLYDAYEQEGLTGVAKTAPAFVGVGANTYGDRKK